jgi:hypothetical protein
MCFFFLDPSPVRRVPIQTGIQRKLNFVSVRTIKGSSSYSRLYEYPTHAVLQSSGLSRTIVTLENGLFRLPSSPDFLSLGSFGLDLRIYRTSALLFILFALGIFELGIFGI